ncbi:HAD-superfamily hydrolase, subfamily IG, 5'-nucleotidase and Purine 5'-nucleotidase family and HAD-like domain-containing protein [Strongyloides ratti]|uniref:HAD-superfamily hydrolase, subfamily IG, 5'-nucleotidase and Purine 5'-nucleotidase family and HAD-like domain-containing protein n=1 Tax=Strongyloides ratti TaxID=34506 RepID=A0A090LS86_STRRB|nr:HAD-superfamily hydrolase, subfamily IG, 5'-nucleotidase and Purine 5'-nucleotidase family and HAD-like domain-containing protein [Strongyloides ratti]CEF70463.1 HAD-superfamily hydrolase, subfamily IG, 5'-nucleotidase and Purine 5'-nucleotidase family and HAD-like domain-containing protein [Strongyloides ratti]
MEINNNTKQNDSWNFPSIKKRNPDMRVFTNRNLRLEKIKWIGFDMDYTLAIYKSPQFEILQFKQIVQRLVNVGYPKEFLKFDYDPIFPTRGLWFDYTYGNLLKVDEFGHILKGMHGLAWLTSNEIEEQYPNKFINLTEQRVYVLNTLFNLPETHLIAQVIDYFENHSDFVQNTEKTGIQLGDITMTYKSIFKDIRKAVDYIHIQGTMKQDVIDNVKYYVDNDPRIAKMLLNLRENGKKIFLLTNSDYYYTNAIMKYILGEKWNTYFDITNVDARKPFWFAEGSLFREVDTLTGTIKIGTRKGPLTSDVVYSGGNCETFSKLVKCKGRDVMYVGDHVYGDVLKSKKSRGWRTFLVVPEIVNELNVWTKGRKYFDTLEKLEELLSEAYKSFDVTTKTKPNNKELLECLRRTTIDMESEYGVFGSLFRSGTSQTFFACQLERFADIYASSCINLIYYPSFYFFRSPMKLMSHEMTVHHGSILHPSGRQGFYHTDTLGEKVRGWNREKRTSECDGFCEDEEDDDTLPKSASLFSLEKRKDSDTIPYDANTEDQLTVKNFPYTDVISHPNVQIDDL